MILQREAFAQNATLSAVAASGDIVGRAGWPLRGWVRATGRGGRRKDARVVINVAAALQRTKKLRDQPSAERWAAVVAVAVEAMPAKSKHS